VRLSLDQANCLLMVEDDGPGIPEEDRDRVFEPFKQLNNDQREMSKEHGLGLAIVHQIVQWHQGQVWVQQSDMGGAQFCVRWPLRSERH
jgi:two-component system sensor histidine kinase RstB